MRRLVPRHDVHQLVVHEPVHALVGGDGLVGRTDGGGLEQEQVARDRSGAGVAGIPEVVEEDGHRLRGSELEEPLVEGEGVLEAARRVGHQVGLQWVPVDQVEIVGLQGVETEAPAGRPSPGEEHQERGADPRGTHGRAFYGGSMRKKQRARR